MPGILAVGRGPFKDLVTIAIKPQHLGLWTHRRQSNNGQLGGARMKPRRKTYLTNDVASTAILNGAADANHAAQQSAYEIGK